MASLLFYHRRHLFLKMKNSIKTRCLILTEKLKTTLIFSFYYKIIHLFSKIIDDQKERFDSFFT